MVRLPMFLSRLGNLWTDKSLSKAGYLLTLWPLMSVVFMFRFLNTMFKSTFKIPENHLSQAVVHLGEKEIFASKIRVAIFLNKTGGKIRGALKRHRGLWGDV